MNQWFECKVRFEKTMENGLVKKVTEPYMVEALTYTEAEARFLAEIEPFVRGTEFEVTDIKKARLSELFFSKDGDDDRWFRAKLAYITLDEKSGQEKRSTQTVLVQARDLRIAITRIDEAMRGSMADYVITSVVETNILDVFRYQPASQDDTNPEQA